MDKSSSLASELWPYLLPRIERMVQLGVGGGGGGSVVSGAPTPHAISSTHHSGILADSQGPQFLKADGSRSVAGNLPVDTGVTIDGVDISAHAANPSAHHAPVTTGNTGIALSGQQVSLFLNAAGSGLEISSGLRIAAGWAGAGLVLNGSWVLDVGQGAGLTVSADAVALTTPGSLSVATTNAAAGNHTHAVTASSDVSAAVAALLKSTAAGGLGLASMFTTGAVDVGQGFTAANTGFRVIYHTHDYQHAHVVVNPGGSWNLDEQFGLDVDDNLLVRGWIVGKHAIQLDGATMLLHFDGPDRQGDLTGQTRGHMGQVPVTETGVTFVPGKFGKAIQTPAATTNRVTNPSFETGTTNWSAYSTGAAAGTRDRVTEEAYAGTYSYRLVKTGGAATDRWGVQCNVAVADSSFGVQSVSVWVNIPAAAGGTQTFVMETGGVLGTYTAALVGPTSGWQRLTISLTGSTAGNGVIYLYTQSADTMTFYIDAVQVEGLAYPTAYCDGSLGTGHSWAGTAHASTSSRTAAVLTYAAAQVLNRAAGTLMAWVYPTASNVGQMVFSHYGASDTYLRATAGGVWDYAVAGTVKVSAAPVVANVWTHICLTWSGATSVLYVNGEQVDTATGNVWSSLAATLTIGSYGVSANQQWTGRIDDVVFLGRAASADEVRAVYESNAPVFAETSTWHWRAGRNRIYADAEGLWGVGANSGTILGLYAGDEKDPAATKSWGGVNLSEGDFLLGRYGVANGGWMLFDQDLVGGQPAWRFGYADVDVIRFDSGGASLYGVLDIDTSGGIYQGTGTFASPTTGLKMWNDGGVGRIGGYNAGTAQWYANTDGKLYAGAGKVQLDASGLGIISSSTASPLSVNEKITFTGSGSVNVGEIYGANYTGLGFRSFDVMMPYVSGNAGRIRLQAYNGSSGGTPSAALYVAGDAAQVQTTGLLVASSGLLAINITGTNLSAFDAAGLALKDDGGNVGLFVADGGNVTMGVATTIANVRLMLYNPNFVIQQLNTGSGLSTYRDWAFNAGGNVAGALHIQVSDTAGGTAYGAGKSVMTLTKERQVGIGTEAPAAPLHVDQSSTTGAVPVLILDQADLSEEMIEFTATVGAGNPIDTAALGTYYGKVRVNVTGVGYKYLALYNS